MDPKHLARASQPAALGGYLKKKVSAAGHGHGHGGHAASVRTAEHNGHQITLTTTYRIEVDGKLLKIPLMVDDDGDVHCDSLPNHQFDSALEMIKAVLDAFPEDFPSPPPKGARAAKAAKPGRSGRTS